jgi:hypothetical protein
MQATLLAGCRAHDLLVVDLPRHLDDAARVALERAATVFVVVPAEVRAAAAARRVVARVGLVPAPLRLVVRGPAPTGVSAAMVADSVGLPLSAELRAEPRLASALDRGEPPALSGRGPLARFAARVLTDLTTGARPVAA